MGKNGLDVLINGRKFSGEPRKTIKQENKVSVSTVEPDVKIKNIKVNKEK